MDFRKNRQDELIELQKMIEDTDDVIEDESGEDEYKRPSRLQDHRKMYFGLHNYKTEQILYYITHNFIIDIKLEIQSKTRNEGQRRRYAKTKTSDKVNSYSDLKRKYKTSSLSSMELQYRKLIFQALGIKNGIYDSGEWVGLICQHQYPEEIYEGQYGELKGAIRELVSTDGDFPKSYKKSEDKEKKPHPNSLDRCM